jgi:hypothetical protein
MKQIRTRADIFAEINRRIVDLGYDEAPLVLSESDTLEDWLNRAAASVAGCEALIGRGDNRA